MDFDDYPCTCRPNEGSPKVIKKHIDQIIETRFEHLEKFTAAFIREVGSDEASKYQLIERTEGLNTSWFFHKIPVIRLPDNPPRPWSPCSGPDCKHPSHG